jgi:hypothetical protein
MMQCSWCGGVGAGVSALIEGERLLLVLPHTPHPHNSSLVTFVVFRECVIYKLCICNLTVRVDARLLTHIHSTTLLHITVTNVNTGNPIP